MRRPSSRMGDGITTHVERVPADAGLAARAARGVRRCGRPGRLDDPRGPTADDLPDCAFVEDTVVVFGDLAVLARPGAIERRAEIPGDPTTRSGRSGSRSLGSRSRARSMAGTSCRSAAPSTWGAAGGRTTRASASFATTRPRGGATWSPSLHRVLHLKSAVTALPDGTLHRADPSLFDTGAVPGDPQRPRGGGVARDPDGRRHDHHGRVGPALGGAFRRPGLRRGHRRHRRVREARGLRHVPLGAHRRPRVISGAIPVEPSRGARRIGAQPPRRTAKGSPAWRIDETGSKSRRRPASHRDGTRR